MYNSERKKNLFPQVIDISIRLRKFSGFTHKIMLRLVQRLISNSFYSELIVSMKIWYDFLLHTRCLCLFNGPILIAVKMSVTPAARTRIKRMRENKSWSIEIVPIAVILSIESRNQINRRNIFRTPVLKTKKAALYRLRELKCSALCRYYGASLTTTTKKLARSDIFKKRNFT